MKTKLSKQITNQKNPEQNLRLRRIIGIITLIIVVANLLLFSFRVYGQTIFWMVIALSALIAFPIMNRLKK